MIGIKANRRKANKEEAEKPFWISFSDLMTALMVLFLVAMVVALISVSTAGGERTQGIKACVVDFEKLVKESEFEGVSIQGKGDDDRSIDFGTLVEFAHGKHSFQQPEHENFIRKFVPRVLVLARGEKCSKWLKRVIVEGFASKNGGSYLTNLNLSYLRSQRVLCTLLNSTAADALSAKDRMHIQTLFLVGGSSFNSDDRNDSQMRRVEMKLEFLGTGQMRPPSPKIALDPGTECPNPR